MKKLYLYPFLVLGFAALLAIGLYGTAAAQDDQPDATTTAESADATPETPSSASTSMSDPTEMTADIISAWLTRERVKKFISAGIRIALILLIVIVVRIVARFMFNRMESKLEKPAPDDDEKGAEAARKRARTLVYLLRRGVRFVIWVIAVILILGEFGVDIGPILAGAGVLGLAFSFGAQSLVKDVITGFFMILENRIRVGDVVAINGTGGLVEALNFRTTILRDFDGNLHVIPNGQVTSIENKSFQWSAMVITVGVTYDADIELALETMKDVGEGLDKDPDLGKKVIGFELFGVSELAASSINLMCRLKTKPLEQWGIGREYRKRLVAAFREKGLEFPFPQQTISFLPSSPPLALKNVDAREA